MFGNDMTFCASESKCRKKCLRRLPSNAPNGLRSFFAPEPKDCEYQLKPSNKSINIDRLDADELLIYFMINPGLYRRAPET